CDEFYVCEKIVNELFWNLKNTLNPHVEFNAEDQNDNGQKETKYKIVDTVRPMGSKINSYAQFNEQHNKWFVLGKLSKLDMVCMDIMMDEQQYDKYISN